MKRVLRSPIAALCAAALAIGVTVAFMLHRAPQPKLDTAHGSLPHLSASSGPGASSSSATSSAAPAAASVSPRAPVRWWSSPAGGVGSQIDVEQPEKGASALRPDQHAYCAILQSSVRSGHNPLTAQSTSESNLLVTTRAWLAELEALSDGPISGAWKTLGPALLAVLQQSQATAKPNPAVLDAVTVISNDARSTCGVDLSQTRS